jgi:Ca2+-binding EF-hand superfamily protein
MLVEPIVTSSFRVWALSSFRFWDINQDGIICSKDIFAMYQAFDKE